LSIPVMSSAIFNLRFIYAISRGSGKVTRQGVEGDERMSAFSTETAH
jgi:hypothetical protein